MVEETFIIKIQDFKIKKVLVEFKMIKKYFRI